MRTFLELSKNSMNTNVQTLILANNEVTISFKDIKNIHLSVYPPFGEVRVAAPLQTNLDSLRAYLSSKIGWIKKQQTKFLNQERLSPREFLTKESHYLRGQRYLLEIVTTAQKPQVLIKHETIQIFAKPNSSKQTKAQILEKWQRAELKKDVEKLLVKWQKILELEINSFTIRKMKTKWGSCSIENKIININLELIKKPVEYLEYVVVHELVHLIERKHNATFVAYLDKYLPNWQASKKELNQFILG